MAEERIGIPPGQRRRVQIGISVFTVLWAMPWTIMAVPMISRGDSAAVGPVAIFAAVWVPCAAYLLSFLLGTTVITEDGLRLNGLLRRGFVPWERIGSTEPVHKGRGSGYWIVRLNLVKGRPRKLPGLYCEGRTIGRRDADFDMRMHAVQDAWRRARRRSSRAA